MTSQPSAPARASSRFARPVGFVRDLPIWTKLGLIMIVPTLATIIVGTLGLLDQVEQANNADRARALAVLSGDGGNLVHALQNERAIAVQLLNAPSSAVDQLRGEYLEQQAVTDTASNRYRLNRATIADVPENLRALLDRIETQLSELPVMRAQVEARNQVPLSIAERRYRVLIADLLEIRDLAAQLTGDTTLTDRMRAAAAVATAKEFLSQERVVVLLALANGEMSQAIRRDYIATLKGQELAFMNFLAVATPEQQELLNRTLTGPELRETLNYEGGFDGLQAGEDPSTVVGADAWNRAMMGRADRLNTVETTLNEQAHRAAVELGDAVQQRVLVETGVLLVTLLVGIMFAWLVARSMARSLRDLRQGALAVAQYGLPQAVARLRDPAVSSNLSPHNVALQIAEPLPVRSRDEFGQVTEAFNAVHLEAVRTAAEQAALRGSVATMFVNLARRSQILVDRLIGHLDRLERGEQDPDRLSELFQLDHLATRMRRNDENLLVLAGADSTRVQRDPASLMDVLRAAQSEVEHYTRIEFTSVDPDIEIAAHAVNDLVHLIAELFDNATAFSAPDTTISVEARRLGDRAVLQVEDRGIGMSQEQYAELNERLATPPQVDVAVSRMMGLVVVARLAARHGVKVELRPAPGRGTIAEVNLPSGVLVPRALAGRSHAPTGFPAARPLGAQAAAAGRLNFPPPLALESGPSARTPEGAGAAFAAAGPPGPGGGPSMPPGGTWPAFGTPAPGPSGPQPVGPQPAGQQPAGPLPERGQGSSRAAGLGAAAAFGGAVGGALGAAAGGAAGAAAGLGGGGSSDQAAGVRAGGPNGAGGRGLPAWADLTGATDTPESPTSPPAEQNPLPQRRPGAQWGDPAPSQWGEPGPDTGPTVPRQSGTPDLWGRDAAPSSGPPAPAASSLPPAAPGAAGPPIGAPTSGAPPVWGAPADQGAPPGGVPGPFGRPIGGAQPGGAAPAGWEPGQPGGSAPASGPPAPARPPVWPPVAEPAAPSEAADQVPGIPERLSASLDMTSEMPKSQPDGAGDAMAPSRYANDLTVELPIFQELESAWFRTGNAGQSSGAASPGAWPPEPAGAGTTTGGTNEWPGGSDSAGHSAGAAAGASGVSWRTIADDGWRAAEAATTPRDGGTTEMGLPRRVPMAQLVPGGVETASVRSERRTPESVRGLLSAYTRGVQRGRDAQGKGADPGNTSPTNGKEQEA